MFSIRYTKEILIINRLSSTIMLFKRLFFTLFIGLTSFCPASRAQSFTAIAQENRIWFMEYMDYSEFQPQLKKYVYFFEGDTLVHNLVYKKLYFQSMDTNAPTLVAGLREEFATKKTYALSFSSGSIVGTLMNEGCVKDSEFQLYDFSVQPNDWLQSACAGSGNNVSDTTAVHLYGQRRKAITFNDINQTWYEGIGSTSGLLSSLWDFSDHHLYDYCKGSFEECEARLWLGTHTNVAKSKGNLFPNPTTEFLNVQVQNYIQEGLVVITDLFGQIVLSVPFAALEQKINVATLANGVYFIQVFDNRQMVYKDKVLIEK